MRKFILPYFLCLIASFSIQAQQADAFYIYRNDGAFNAFFDTEVDSITYSHYDVDSLYHIDWQMQVIHTADSIYRIPLEAIDSITFAAPEPIISKNVVRMEENLLDYLIGVDGMVLTFANTIPHFLLPSNGNILVCTDFENKLFEEGFVGKVCGTSFSTDGYVVFCDTVTDIAEIFERLIAIEELTYKENTVETRGVWESANIPIQASLNYDVKGPVGLEASMSGTIDGMIKATVIYNISLTHQHVSVRLNHDWSLGANVKLKSESKKSFKEVSSARELTSAIRFPALLPLLKFQLFGHYFVRGNFGANIDISLNGPVHKYASGITFENGKFKGSHRRLGKPSGDSTPKLSSTFSLNGSAQCGYLIECYLGTIECLGYVKTAVDFYIGPKISGNFNIDLASSISRDYYNTIKDSKLSASLLSLDVEAFGEASYLGQPIARHTFFETSIPSLLYNEWYLFPTFSNMTVKREETQQLVTLSYSPSRDVLQPLILGIGLYDEGNALLASQYADKEYKSKNTGFEVTHSFSSLENDKLYTARPIIKFENGILPANPSQNFYLNKNNSENEGDDSGGGNNDSEGNEGNDSGEGSDGDTNEGGDSGGGDDNSEDNGDDSENDNTSGDVEDDEEDPNLKGDVLYTCPDEHHPHAIDLGIGVKWACCNVGASLPEEPGGYYAWGEIKEQDGDGYEHFYYNANGVGCYAYLGDDISKTEYDVAYVKMGDNYRMPTLKELEALNNCTSQWVTYKGMNGRVYMGPNGNRIFLPASGSRIGTTSIHFTWLGHYWSSNVYWSNANKRYANAHYLTFEKGFSYCSWGNYGNRENGASIRPVYDE